MVIRLSAIAAALLCLSATRAPEAPSRCRLEREELVRCDNALVVRLSVTVPKAEPAGRTKLVFRWRDVASVSIGNGMWEETKAGRRAEVVIVAQVAPATKLHPALLVLSTQQKSKGAAHTFGAYPLEDDAKLPEVIEVDVKAGDFAPAEPLRIGTLGGEPMYLWVDPFPAE